MPVSKIRYIMGERYNLTASGLTKEEAIRKAQWMRKGQFKARIEKVSRGNYNVWSR